MDFTSRQFRNVLGLYATGIAVVTALAPDMPPVGVTVNSFTSLSLEPPLIGFALGHGSSALAPLRAAGAFAVNILAAGQEDLSDRFAGRGEDRFSGLALLPNMSGNAPLLADCLAHIECRLSAEHPAGDHQLLIGAVDSLRVVRDAPPLVYFRGGYRGLMPPIAG